MDILGLIGSSLEKYFKTHEPSIEILGFSSSLVDLTNEKEVHKLKKFLDLNTAVYGEDVHNTRISEDTPVHPTSYYGIAKYSSECLFRKVIDTQKESTLFNTSTSLNLWS